ncbi:hypothetical protein [Clostridium vincentii]|uniref:Uncharacterized protein n=1 Tax=Clostridium vincentii TaxID=52704 RepID=A0A2T0BFF4_9CLOT|nr:hypothetical protein [Clostridium vincentii]PRR82557.1 hypothetical protein CLVI_16920 [Clostridium vincentii]
MSKNKKKEIIDGVINSKGIKFPAPMKSYNSPTSDYEFTDQDKIEITTHTRY